MVLEQEQINKPVEQNSVCVCVCVCKSCYMKFLPQNSGENVPIFRSTAITSSVYKNIYVFLPYSYKQVD